MGSCLCPGLGSRGQVLVLTSLSAVFLTFSAGWHEGPQCVFTECMYEGR